MVSFYEYAVICVNQGVNKCNLHLLLEHTDPGSLYCVGVEKEILANCNTTARDNGMRK